MREREERRFWRVVPSKGREKKQLREKAKITRLSNREG